ncbi:MAG: O-antigen ligase family protein [Alphaproteobacteria bacterium]
MNRFSPPALYALLWLAAFISALMFFHGREAYCVALSVSVLSTGLMFIVLKHPFSQNSSRPSLIVTGLLGAFWLLALLSVATGEIRFISFIFFGFFSVLPLSFLWGLLLWNNPLFKALMIKNLVAMGFLLSLSCLVQYASMPQMLFYGRTEWPLANPNSMAALLSFFFFLGFGGLLGAENPRYKKIFALLCLTVLLAMFTTGSRGAFIALASASAVSLFLLRKHVYIERKNLALYAGAALAGIVLFSTLFASHQPEELTLIQRVEATVAGKMPALWNSPALWTGTGDLIKDHFWTGTGIGTFYLYYPPYRGADLQTAGLMVHNDPLQFWAEMGVAAPIVFYALALSALFLTLRTMLKIPPGDPRRIFIVIPACGLAAMILHSHITFNFYVFPCLMMAGITLSFWLHNLNEIETARPCLPPSEGSRLILKGSAIAALFAALFLFLMMQGSLLLTDKAQKAAQSGDLSAFEEMLGQAEMISQRQNPSVYLIAANARLGLLEMPDNGLTENDRLLLTEQGQNFLRRAETLNPRHPDIFYAKGHYYKAAGDIGAAEKSLLHALDVDPLHLSARQMLADLYAARGDKQKALETLKGGLPFVEIQRDNDLYLNQTAMLALELGDLKTQSFAMKSMGRNIGYGMGFYRGGYRPLAVKPSQ